VIFTSPLGLLALLAIPAIVAIHLFRRRFPVRPVAGLFLWQIARPRPEGGGTISKLPITTSLILECLAALALALVLAGARLFSAGDHAHLVVLLDDSASMAAVNARGESTRDRAARRVALELDRLGRTGRVTLVRSGERPSVLAGPAAFPADAMRALEGWKPNAPHHALALGLRLARELAGRTGKLMVTSDGSVDAPLANPADKDAGVSWVSLGQPLPNVGILAAERTLMPDQGRGAVMLALGNYSEAPARRRVSVTAGEKGILALEFDVPPGRSSITLPLPTGLPAVRVALSNDALARDDEVVLAEPRPRIVGVENRLPAGRGRDALAKALAAVAGVTSTEAGHLVFLGADTLDRPQAPGVWRVGFGRAPASWLAGGAPHDYVGPFVLEKRHPLLQGVTLGGVVWAGAMPLTPGAVRPLISTGEHALVGLAGSARTPEPNVVVNLDLDRTNLIRSPDWPILISNLVEMRRESLPGPERWNYRVGEWVRVRLGREPKGTLRVRCGGIERTLPATRLLEFVAPSPGGLLQIVEGPERVGGSETILFELGVNFLDEAESNLRDRLTAQAGRFAEVAALRAESGPESDPLFWMLLAIGALAILSNWWLLGPARNQGSTS
jgi:Ca-activated chloride channel homolog